MLEGQIGPLVEVAKKDFRQHKATVELKRKEREARRKALEPPQPVITGMDLLAEAKKAAAAAAVKDKPPATPSAAGAAAAAAEEAGKAEVADGDAPAAEASLDTDDVIGRLQRDFDGLQSLANYREALDKRNLVGTLFSSIRAILSYIDRLSKSSVANSSAMAAIQASGERPSDVSALGLTQDELRVTSQLLSSGVACLRLAEIEQQSDSGQSKLYDKFVETFLALDSKSFVEVMARRFPALYSATLHNPALKHVAQLLLCQTSQIQHQQQQQQQGVQQQPQQPQPGPLPRTSQTFAEVMLSYLVTEKIQVRMPLSREIDPTSPRSLCLGMGRITGAPLFTRLEEVGRGGICGV